MFWTQPQLTMCDIWWLQGSALSRLATRSNGVLNKSWKQPKTKCTSQRSLKLCNSSRWRKVLRRVSHHNAPNILNFRWWHRALQCGKNHLQIHYSPYLSSHSSKLYSSIWSNLNTHPTMGPSLNSLVQIGTKEQVLQIFCLRDVWGAAVIAHH
jgi:hypothetical protein